MEILVGWCKNQFCVSKKSVEICVYYFQICVKHNLNSALPLTQIFLIKSQKKCRNTDLFFE